MLFLVCFDTSRVFRTSLARQGWAIPTIRWADGAQNNGMGRAERPSRPKRPASKSCPLKWTSRSSTYMREQARRDDLEQVETVSCEVVARSGGMGSSLLQMCMQDCSKKEGGRPPSRARVITYRVKSWSATLICVVRGDLSQPDGDHIFEYFNCIEPVWCTCQAGGTI